MLFAERPSLPVRRWMLAGYWAAIFFLTHWPEIDRFRVRPDWPFPESDKLVHASFYAGWVVLWWWVLSVGQRRVSRAATVWLAVGAAGYSIFDELTQAIVGRHPDFFDFACDMLGVLAALALLSAWQRRQRAIRPSTLKPRAA